MQLHFFLSVHELVRTFKQLPKYFMKSGGEPVNARVTSNQNHTQPSLPEAATSMNGGHTCCTLAAQLKTTTLLTRLT